MEFRYGRRQLDECEGVVDGVEDDEECRKRELRALLSNSQHTCGYRAQCTKAAGVATAWRDAVSCVCW